MVCAFTGHRPQRLPWGSDEEDPRCKALKQMLFRAVSQAVERGAETFLCGMARGCDTYFAEAVLECMDDHPGLDLIAMVPCPQQADRWPAADRMRYASLLARCSKVEILERAYRHGCMARRNRTMVERADLLISVYDGGSGGTAQTVKLAKAMGVEIIPVWL